MRFPPLMVSGAALLAAAACAAPPPSFDEAHRAAITDSVGVVLEAYRQYAAVGNWDALLGLYEDGPAFRWIEDGEVAYDSVADIRAAIADLPSGTRIVTSHGDVRIVPVAPGVAWVSLRFESMFLEPTGTGFQVNGTSTMLFRHGPDGWRIVGGHSSTARPGSADGA